jgi:hypothetical protein
MSEDIELEEDGTLSLGKQIVDINSIYRVEIDELNHTLQRYVAGGEVITKGKYVGQLTKPKWETVGYFSNMTQVLNEVISLSLIKNDVISIEQYIIRIENLLKELNNGQRTV